jgi:hypothetical protein
VRVDVGFKLDMRASDNSAAAVQVDMGQAF